MAVAISSVTTNTNDGTSATISVTTSESPVTTKVGDLVVVIHGNDFYTLSNMPTPTSTGSPTFNNIVDADGGTNLAHIRAWFYYANTAGAQTVSVTETGAHDEEKDMAVFVLTGAASSSPIDGAASGFSATDAQPVCPTISPATNDAYLIAAVQSGGAAGPGSYTPPGSLTQKYNVSVGQLLAAGAIAQLSASGATGTFTWTNAVNRPYASVTFAIKSGTPATTPQGTKSTNRHPGRGPRTAANFQTKVNTASIGNTVNIDGSLTVTATTTATVSVDHTVGGTRATTANRTATVAVTHTVDGPRPETVNRTATVAVTHTIGGTRPITVGLSATVAVTHAIGGSRPTTVNRTATVAVTHTVAGSRPITVGLTASIVSGKDISGTRLITVNRTGVATVTHTIGGSRPVTVALVADITVIAAGGSFSSLFLPFFR